MKYLQVQEIKMPSRHKSNCTYFLKLRNSIYSYKPQGLTDGMLEYYTQIIYSIGQILGFALNKSYVSSSKILNALYPLNPGYFHTELFLVK